MFGTSGGWPPGRWPTWAQDAALAVALTALGQWELSEAAWVEGPMWVQRLTFAVITGAVALRRSAPLLAAVVGSAGLAAQTIWGGDAPVVAGFLAGMVITHSVAMHLDLRRSVLGLVVILAGVHTYLLVNLETFQLADEVGNLAIFVTIWGLGRAVRVRQLQRHAAEERAMQAELEQEASARAAVAEERGRIARELHDIVAHGVSLMVLQAGAARQVLDQDPEKARQPLLAVEAAGRQALEEMQRLLGVLRQGDGDLAVSPLASLDELDGLVRHMRDAGLDVQVRFEGERRPLSTSVELSMFRITQEALTNALKHAGGTRAHVAVRYLPDAAEVEIVDQGGRGGSTPSSGGHGLAGMRERVALFGGRFDAGPTDDGGWAVRARFPVEVRLA